MTIVNKMPIFGVKDTTMKNLLTLMSFVLLFSFAVVAQPLAPASQHKEADPKDVGSIDNIMKAVYDVISGEAGKPRDWDRFRTLFHKDARMIPSGKNPQTGVTGARVMSPDSYITSNSPFFEKNGFFEREIARHVDQFGNIAQVFSTYHAFRNKDDKDPFMRGINSFQLLNDGKRWWVLTIYWQQETPEHPIPEKYMKSK